MSKASELSAQSVDGAFNFRKSKVHLIHLQASKPRIQVKKHSQ